MRRSDREVAAAGPTPLAAELAPPAPGESPPLLSVVVPNYNGLAHLQRCLPSLEAQTLPDVEVIVVDDASSDRSVAYCRDQHPRVRLVCQPQNGGFARAANAGIQAARAPLIALINNDTEMAADWAAHAVSPFDDPSVGSVACVLCQMQRPERIDRAGDGYAIAGGAFNRLYNRDPSPPSERTEAVFGASAAAAVYRRSALVEVGLLDESFDAYYEDVDLAWRLQLAGWRCVLHHGARGLHVGSASYGPSGERLVRFSARNAETVFWSALPLPLLLRSIPAHLLFLLLQGTNRLVRGELRHYLRGKWDFLRALPHLPQRRRQRQALRRVPLHALNDVLEWHWLRSLVAQQRDRRR